MGDNEKPQLFGKLDSRVYSSATDTITFPQPEPRARCECFVVPSICSRDVGFPEWSNVGTLKHLFELLDVIDDAFNIHLEQYNGAPSPQDFEILLPDNLRGKNMGTASRR